MKNLKKNILYNNILWLAIITLLTILVTPYISIIYMTYYLIIYYPYKVVNNQKKVQDEMVKFGLYLLSDQRDRSIESTDKQSIYDTDLKNYKFFKTDEDK
ncbi:hypothetical protein IIF7_11283 [Zunongwangia atlantica 22II14-10F7]|uniref:Uncharacterized protein n=1 Tax=Zunongwangia atlantica 22II14-10F7 TaxID=1185767 RepID=A0A1Y1T305_9FLAO|nr:hypothetical protein IIF7_11283 [Zunongwangia atlantica 22II14-10F7]